MLIEAETAFREAERIPGAIEEVKVTGKQVGDIAEELGKHLRFC